MRNRFKSLAWVLLAGLCFAADDQPSAKVEAGTTVDSGSFGIVVNGKRVATEKFRMEQHGGSNTASAELRYEGDVAGVVQSADMEVLSNGNLKKYTWKEVQPTHVQITVEPQDENFLVSHVVENDKPAKDNTHPLSPQTSILDDNFYSQMQVLAWKYMALSCKMNAEQKMQCDYKPAKLPVLNPHQQQSQLISMEFTGRHAMRWQKTIGSYNVFKLKAENADFELWVNDQNKLVKVSDPGENIEVVRD